ncbi:MAG: hypothetical protein ACPGVG_12685 [Mycobacterium sp.]
MTDDESVAYLKQIKRRFGKSDPQQTLEAHFAVITVQLIEAMESPPDREYLHRVYGLTDPSQEVSDQ